jgi:hypothetical protein
MTWVLILTPPETAGTPAVIGGFAEREHAEAAGLAATDYPDDVFKRPAYTRFTVIPGAATFGAVGATHSVVERVYDNGVRAVRTTWRDAQKPASTQQRLGHDPG